MKKKFALIVMCAAAMSMVATGCASSNDDVTSGSDYSTSEESTLKASDIEYNVTDYVTLGDYTGLTVTLEDTYDVTDEDVIEEIGSNITIYPYYKSTGKTTVEDGDEISLSYEGYVDGEKNDSTCSDGTYLTIGSNSYIDGFEDGLIGAKVGDTVTLELTFPDEYGVEDLNGKDVTFRVTINDIVKEKTIKSYEKLLKLDDADEYISENFGYETVEDYYDYIEQSLVEDNESQRLSDIKTAVLEAVINNATISGYPDQLLELSCSEYKQSYIDMCEQYGMEFEDYLENYGMTEDEFDEYVEEYETNLLNNQFILESVAIDAGLEADEEGYEEYINEIISSYGYEDEDALYEAFGEDYVRNAYLWYEVALNYLVDNNDVEYVEPSEEEETSEETTEETEETSEETEGEASDAE